MGPALAMVCAMHRYNVHVVVQCSTCLCYRSNIKFGLKFFNLG